MKPPDPTQLTNSLASTGVAWRNAVTLAANHLLSDYRVKWERLVPVELRRVAFSRQAQIIESDKIEREAVLLPGKSHFTILVRADLRGARYRCSVAHEIAHTFFYTPPTEDAPGKRIIAHCAKEEPFCFDVARHILAPKWQLEALGLLKLSDHARLLQRLVEDLRLSRLWAARVILADYSLANGIAGWWLRTEAGWELEKGQATASPQLGRKERAALRYVGKKSLNGEKVRDAGCSVTMDKEAGGARAFVMVTLI